MNIPEITTEMVTRYQVEHYGRYTTIRKEYTSILNAYREEMAALPEPPAPDEEWVRVPVGTEVPKGTRYCFYATSEVDWTPGGSTDVMLTRSDLDAILKPAPTPAEKLAEALNAADPDAAVWCADDIQNALDNMMLVLNERN